MRGRVTSSSEPENDAEVAARVREAMDLVVVIARQVRRQIFSRLDLEELTSYGHEGLIQAARGFRTELGVPFRRWANLRIRGAIIDGIRAQANLPRGVYRRLAAMEAGDRVHEDLLERDSAAPAATPEDADNKLDAHMAGMATAMALGLIGEKRSISEDIADRSPLAEESLAREELLHSIRAGVDERPDEEKQLLNLVYFEGMTVADAGRQLGLSKSWACRIHGRAIEGLSKYLRRNRAV
jgi:RNA polymerase sigma factor for flagellar operon FliA